jgi:L-lactate utilization protein LutB
MGKKKNKIILSSCCRAKVRVSGIGDFEGDKSACTQCYVCTKCNDACDIYIPIRRVWNINPSTKIKGDERAKITNKEINREIKEIGNA